jgi:formylglycine-generating enzyme required for sulfatase activity
MKYIKNKSLINETTILLLFALTTSTQAFAAGPFGENKGRGNFSPEDGIEVPEELIQQIAGYLDMRSLLSFAQSCQDNYNSATRRLIEVRLKKAERDAILGEMIEIKAGTYLMGSDGSEPSLDNNETRFPVRIDHDFKMSKYPVTQKQYQAVMGSESLNQVKQTGENFLPEDGRNRFLGDELPMLITNIKEARDYFEKVNKKLRKQWEPELGPLIQLRLPTEEEWEYATTVPLAQAELTEHAGKPIEINANHTLHPGSVLPKTRDFFEKGPRAVNSNKLPASERGFVGLAKGVIEATGSAYSHDASRPDQANPDQTVARGSRCDFPDETCRSSRREAMERTDRNVGPVGFRAVIETEKP